MVESPIKHMRIIFSKQEFKKLEKKKEAIGARDWKDFVLKLAKIKNNNHNHNNNKKNHKR